MSTATQPSARYLTCAETAQLLRRKLAQRFPGVRFRVRSKVYSGGASINVRWTEGPGWEAVNDLTSGYQGSGFDGMIDLKYGNRHWLLPDSTLRFASTPGTEGSMGTVPAAFTAIPPDAELVRLGTDYVFCTRLTQAEVDELAAH